MSKFARLEVFHPLVKFEKPGLMTITRELANEFLSSPSGSTVSIRTSSWETYETRDVNFDPEPEAALKYYQFTRIVNNIDSAGFALNTAQIDARRVIKRKAEAEAPGFSSEWVQCINFDDIDVVTSALNPARSFLVMRSSEISGAFPPLTEEGDRALAILTEVEKIMRNSIDGSLGKQIPAVEGFIDDNLVGGVKLGSIPTKVAGEEVLVNFLDNLKKNIMPARIALGPVAIDYSS